MFSVTGGCTYYTNKSNRRRHFANNKYKHPTSINVNYERLQSNHTLIVLIRPAMGRPSLTELLLMI